MRLTCSIALACLFAITTAAKATPVNLNLSTGTATYAYTGPNGSGTAMVVPPYAVGGTTYWTTLAGASWINDAGPVSQGQAPMEAPGIYTYTTIFTLTQSEIFTGSFSSDNQGTVSLSCSGCASSVFSISNSGDTTYQTLTSLGGYTLAAGTYTLSAAVTNAGTNYTAEGLLLGASVAPAPTPEPSSLMLLGTGLAGIAGVARRKFFA